MEIVKRIRPRTLFEDCNLVEDTYLCIQDTAELGAAANQAGIFLMKQVDDLARMTPREILNNYPHLETHGADFVEAILRSWAHGDMSFPIRVDLTKTRGGYFLSGVGTSVHQMIALASEIESWAEFHKSTLDGEEEEILQGVTPFLRESFQKPFPSSTVHVISTFDRFSEATEVSTYLSKIKDTFSTVRVRQTDDTPEQLGDHLRILVSPWVEVLQNNPELGPILSQPRSLLAQPIWTYLLEGMVDFPKPEGEFTAHVWLDLWGGRFPPLIAASLPGGGMMPAVVSRTIS